jgi:NRPS condensation-like uncharacterized protein
MTASATPDTIPLTEADAGFVYFPRAGKCWSIHLEIHLTGRIDPDRLRSAALLACERHPIARARILPLEKGDRGFRWGVQEQPSPPELEIVECDGEGAPSLAEARARVMASFPSLEAVPPFALRLLRRPQHDVLILCVRHAASDGLGTIRLMTSILRAYAGLEDPLPTFDQLQARDLRPLVVPATRRERLWRLAKLPATVFHRSKPVALAPVPSEDGGEGVLLLSFDERETAALEQRRQGAATLNDVMLGGLALAIRRWNQQHGARPGRIALAVPFNLRPPRWNGEVLGNFAALLPVSIPKRTPDDLDALIAAAAKSTQRGKRNHTPQALFDVLPRLMAMLPLSFRRQMGVRRPDIVDRVQDTAILSNLGRVTLPDPGGEAGTVRDAWITPPAGFTRGVAIAFCSWEGRLLLGLTHQRAYLSDGAAAEFAELYRDVLFGDEQPEPAGYSSTTSASPSLTG